MTGLRLPTTALLAGIFVGLLSCERGFAQSAGPSTATEQGTGYRWVTGEPAEVEEPLEQQPGALPIPAKILRYARTLVRQYDVDGSGRLESREWPDDRRTFAAGQADADHDQVISADELARFIADHGRDHKIRMPRRPLDIVFEDAEPLEADVDPAADPADNEPSGDADTPPEEPTTEDDPAAESESESDPEEGLIDKPADGAETDDSTAAEPAAGRLLKPAPEPEAIDPRLLPSHTRYYVPRRRLAGMPEWFQTRDTNGDGQISLAEYSKRPTQATIARFRRYDRNKDGVITTSEYARASGGR